MKNFTRAIIFTATFIFTSLQCAIAQDQSAMVSSIDSLMRAHYAPYQPGASLLVYKDHTLLFQGAYGMANMENVTAVSENTMFRIGSVTKQFTSVMILKMVSEKKLSLNDPVSKFYPEYFADKESILVKHLLNHSAGIKDLSRIKAIRSLMQITSTPDDLVAIISKESVEFQPGEKYSYSNSGYVVLGGILEKVSRASYAELLKKFIFLPLKMEHTFFANREDLTDPFASGYFNRGSHFVPAPDINSSLMFAAGGLWSTTEDMAIWNQALHNGKILDAEHLALAFASGHLNNGKTTGYGFGFRNCTVNGSASIEHGGGIFGFSSYGISIKEKGVYVIILTNFERDNAYDDLATQIAAIAIGTPYKADPEIFEVFAHRLEALQGTYLLDDRDTLQVVMTDHGLLIERNGKETIELQAISETSFLVLSSLEDQITFDPGNYDRFLWKPRRAMTMEAIRLDSTSSSTALE